MDIQSAASRTTHSKSRNERGEKEDRSKTHSTHRSTRYKEKYQSMRERFEKVNAVRCSLLL
ncbi:hypothetical protein P691DRAFT_397378 [Macrolepiota fuliginosa MF-IS2]|uniref:Uncharacterized protein n=1 Tax=Macrolepiota fuliginosa MF-IS2 TaxID=1400762 RepID=A0A9P5XRM8_9AGAR|nr:hypothetical protein P691DRAFT_397378 [Macrolepiota fuliginosa MF-IS2]